MLLTDDVYGTFVHGFRSLLGELPQNTIGVYSYSKYFGCTGWRLGVIAIHQDNVFDRMIAKLPQAELQALDRRYGALTLEPRKLKLIDRIVADSRDVALNHTAGLSLPQQVMMTLFSLAELMDGAKRYQQACMEIVHRRAQAMIDGLGIAAKPGPLYDAYYGLIDFEFWARKNIGEEAVEYLKKNVHPLDLAFRLAETQGIVLLNGGGFEAPDWSLRVSLANLPDDVYDDIGRGVRAVARAYLEARPKDVKVTPWTTLSRPSESIRSWRSSSPWPWASWSGGCGSGRSAWGRWSARCWPACSSGSSTSRCPPSSRRCSSISSCSRRGTRSGPSSSVA
jgi:aspartate 4-decarboxylase